jgi:hypothetical protein
MSLCAFTLCLAATAPQAPDLGPGSSLDPGARPAAAREIRHVPIREWIATSPAPLMPRLGSFLGFLPPPDPAYFLLGSLEEDRQLIGRETIADLVRRFSPVDWDEPDLELGVEGSTLRISGPPDKVHLVEATVSKLTRAMVHNLRIQAELYRISENRDFPALATSDQLDGISRGLQRIWVASATCPSGNVISLSKDRTTNYVYDVNVEVAQEAKIGDPQIAALFEGIRIAVEPHVLTESSDLVLYTQFAFGEQRQPLVSRGSGHNDMPSLDVPSVNSNSGVFSGRVRNGGALLLSVQGESAGGGSMLLVVSATRQDSDDSTGEELGIFPVSALLSPALRLTVTNTSDDSYTESPFRLEHAERQDRSLGPRDQDGMFNLISNALGFDDGEELSIQGGHVIVKGRPETRRSAMRIVRGLQDQWLTAARVALHTTLHEVHFSDTVFPKGGAGPVAGAEVRSLHRITFPALLGRPHTVIRGHESTVIRDIDVEIAQNSSISDPIVDQIFSGVILSLYVFPQQRGVGIETELDLLHVPAPQRRPRETKDGGDLYLPRTARSRFSHSGSVPSGQDLFLGEGPTMRIGQRSFRTRQTLRITLP